MLAAIIAAVHLSAHTNIESSKVGSHWMTSHWIGKVQHNWCCVAAVLHAGSVGTDDWAHIIHVHPHSRHCSVHYSGFEATDSCDRWRGWAQPRNLKKLKRGKAQDELVVHRQTSALGDANGRETDIYVLPNLATNSEFPSQMRVDLR